MKHTPLPAVRALIVLLALLSVQGCREAKFSGTGANHAKSANSAGTEGKPKVTSLIFPSYDFVRAVAGDRVSLVMLLPPGAESHSYEPSPRDIVTIRESDLFIYPGGESTKWVDRIIASMEIPEGKIKILKLVDLVDTVEEEITEGMEDDKTEDAGGAPVFDEHVWTSPANAKSIVLSICETLCSLDNANAVFYRQNAADYIARLDELDASFRSIAESAKRKTIVFGDRFPFRYFADAFGLSYFAAFPGCSAESEPSAATVAFLINKVKNENIPVIFHIELSNEKMADTISEASGAKKLLFHSCHNITKSDFENGANYLDLQKINADHLREALW